MPFKVVAPKMTELVFNKVSEMIKIDDRPSREPGCRASWRPLGGGCSGVLQPTLQPDHLSAIL